MSVNHEKGGITVRSAPRLMLIIMLLLAVLGGTWVLASGSPVSWGSCQMGLLLADRPIPISADSELLRFTLSDNLSQAEVFVQYTLTNQSDQHQTVKMCFFLDGDKPIVQLGEDELVVEMTDSAPGFLRPFELRPARVIDPGGGRPMDIKDQSDRLSMALFNLNLQPQTTSHLTIRYSQTSWGDPRRYANYLHTYSYLLLPASAFQSFRDLTIEIDCPSNTLIGHSLPLTRVQQADGRQLLRGAFAELPEDDLHFSVMSKTGLWLGQTKKSFYEGFALVAFLVLGILAAYTSAYAIGSIANASTARVISAFLSPAAAMLSAWTFYRTMEKRIRVQNFGTYFEDFFVFVVASVVLVIISCILGIAVTSRRWKARQPKPPCG